MQASSKNGWNKVFEADVRCGSFPRFCNPKAGSKSIQHGRGHKLEVSNFQVPSLFHEYEFEVEIRSSIFFVFLRILLPNRLWRRLLKFSKLLHLLLRELASNPRANACATN